jgi:thiol:disulfide interchange protein DsbD
MRQFFWRALGLLLLLSVGSIPARGQRFDLRGFGGLGGSATAAPDSSPVALRAAANAEPLLPGSDAFINVEVTIDPRFHIQSAAAPKPYIAARLTLPPIDGVETGAVRYPVPHDVPAPAGLAGTLSVYEGKVILQVPVKVDAAASPGERSVELAFLSQACDDKACLPPQKKMLTVHLRIGAAGDAQREPDPALNAAARSQTYAAPIADAPATAAASTNAANGATAAPSEPAWAALAGVKLLSPAEQVDLINARPYQAYNASELHYPLWGIILLALLGGIILNVMPCVLPVIPLKVLSLVQQAHGDRRVAIVHAMAFSAGVVVLFVALAILLRTAGLFYGQQFQSPAFLIAMVLFVVALALSMLGVWTINPPNALYQVEAKLAGSAAEGAGLAYATPAAHKHSAYLGSFANGLMATLLATPCSAPYLGPVLAWALVQPTWLTALALGLVGIGMSLPYLVLAAFPALLNRFPRAGRWSELLKQGLGIVMLGVAVYLIALIPNVQLWPWVMLAAVITGLVCWAWGQIPAPGSSSGRVWGVRVAALVLGLAAGGGIFALARRAPPMMLTARVDGGAGDSPETWHPFNVALLDAALAQGRPVVIDWTADWCINCRALDAAVLSRPAVQDAFSRSGVLLLRADLSEDNPPATALNRKLGGEAIPVLAIFSPQRSMQPVVLRDSYTQARVIEEVAAASAQ